ncbi:MAG: universal stress protein [Aquimonas sp.]|nr:universal stress protein [Aquimonas sp.]
MSTPRDAPIVAASDFSPSAGRALDRAAALAQVLARPLRLVHAPMRAGWLQQLAPPSVLPEPRAAAVAALAAEAARLAPFEVDTMLLEQPLDLALDALGQPLLLVLGGAEPVGLRRLLLGSTAERVLQQHRLPVLLARQPADQPYRGICVCTDFSEPALQGARFALGLGLDAETVMLHALELHWNSTLSYAGVGPDGMEHYRKMARDEALHSMQAFAAALDAPDAVPAIREGHAAQVLEDFVAEAAVDLVVLGVSGRSALERGLLGSFSRQAAAQLSCDLLIVPAVA